MSAGLRAGACLPCAMLAGVACAQLPAGQAPDARSAALCEARLAPTRVEVRMRRSPLAVEHAVTAAQLSQRTPGQPPAWMALGLTERRLEMRVRWQSSALRLGAGRAGCLRPQVTVELLHVPRIHIARELPADSCAYAAVHAHERRHLEADERAFEATGRFIEQRLADQLGNRVFYGELDALQARLDATVERDWLPATKARFAEVAQVHAQIDSPEEYARNRTVCGGEIPRLLRGAR